MELENRTPFPALEYDVVDARGDESHVVVARGSYALRAAPEAGESDGARITHVAALTEGELVVSDVAHGEINRSSVKYESDLAQSKPRCDVIVIGSAHAPAGEAVARVDVRVRVRRLVAIPNLAGACTLLDHRLAVRGARSFERKDEGWALTDPEPFEALPLRYEHAFGGQLKVYADDDAAKRLDDAHRLSEEARRAHPEVGAAPVAHATCAYNPLGVGFLEGWYADAAEVKRWPAPRIEAPGAGITAEIFARMVAGEVRAGEVPELSPRGVGVIAKPWQPRLKLAGTFDDRWLAERWPYMPPDFDMAYWNGAHPDMQCDYLFGGELAELWNLLPRSAPGVAPETAGTACRFHVPEAAVVVRLTGKDDAVSFAAVPIDTVIVDLDQMRLSLVWRARIPASLEVEGTSLLALGYMKQTGEA
ncbi:DUF2169 family type VI secretion system accessory protein [Sorangium cellulosum]|uniref:DUF2169 domain-containing protein n=1 Tax=Sorangium cellulosum TaxID=56 RepID=A0A150QBA5_SORCE|nr:DUF2169 domain-containing protein [Sorangium cellulosum]KYF65220.1 hypothetical protein BE15_02380 [Sorangium cellulosum]